MASAENKDEELLDKFWRESFGERTESVRVARFFQFLNSESARNSSTGRASVLDEALNLQITKFVISRDQREITKADLLKMSSTFGPFPRCLRIAFANLFDREYVLDILILKVVHFFITCFTVVSSLASLTRALTLHLYVCRCICVCGMGKKRNENIYLWSTGF